MTVLERDQPRAGIGLTVRQVGGQFRVGGGVTGERGRLVIGDLAPGWYEVASDRGDALEAEVVSGKTEAVTLHLAGRTTLNVVVKNEERKSIAGALVVGSWPGTDRTVGLGETDNLGALRVAGLAGIVTIDVRAEGYWNPDPRTLRSAEGETSYDLTFTLKAGGVTLEGKAQDPDGKGIAAAAVGCAAEGWVRRPGLDQDGTMSAPPAPFDTSTRNDGTFSLHGLGPGTYVLEVRKTGYAVARRSVEAGPESEPLFVTLQRGGSLGGRVVNDMGEPSAHAVVAANQSDKRYQLTHCGTDGRYLIESVPPGDVDLSAYRVDEGQAATCVTVSPGAQVVADLRLARGRVVTGRVLDANRNGLARWVVAAKGGTPRVSRYTSTDGSGLFKVASAPAGSMTVSVWPEHGDDGAPTSSVVTTEDYVEIVLSEDEIASFWVRGRLVDVSGMPLANRVLSARQGQPKPSGPADSRSEPRTAPHERIVNTSASTDSAGRFRIGRFGPGSATIFAWGPDNTYCPIASARLDRDLDLGTLQLTAPVVVEVTVASGSATAIEVLHGGYFIVGRLELKTGESWDVRLGKGDYTLRWKVDGAPRETSASVGTGVGTTKITLL